MKTRTVNNKPIANYPIDWISENLNNIINGCLVSEWIFADEYTDDFHEPIWNGSQWIEGMTVAEINAKNAPIYEKEIVDIYSMLCERALRSSMGKGYEYDTYDKLKYQEDEYRKKYNVAKGLVINLKKQAEIQEEMDREFPTPVLDATLTAFGLPVVGTDYEKMCAIIVFRFEYGADKLNNFEYYICTFRIKCRDFVSSSQWNRLDLAFDLARSIPLELTVSEAEIFFNQFENL